MTVKTLETSDSKILDINLENQSINLVHIMINKKHFHLFT